MAVLPTILNSSVLQKDPTYRNSKTSSRFYTSKLLNYVEPVTIGGFTKTVFYSEYGTNFNVGDRVFILNGNYDSNSYISSDKYGIFTDGYRVLGVDGCRIVLDLDYTGVLPFEEVPFGTGTDYVRVTHVSSQREFDYVDSLIVPLKSGSFSPSPGPNGMWSNFLGDLIGTTASLYNNEIIYSSGTFSSVTPGFWVKDSSGFWQNISVQFDSNFIVSGNPDFTPGYLYVVGEDFTRLGKTFRQRVSYKYGQSGWEVEGKFKEPIISKLNFRSGKFSGIHNDGSLGTDIKTVRWSGGTWNSGLMLNVEWISGTMNSKSYAGETIYKAVLRSNSVVQSVDTTNNQGFGMNFVLDSTFLRGIINNGNLENCNIGSSIGFPALDVFYGSSGTESVTINGGQYVLCDILDSKIYNSTLTDANVGNSNISGSRIVNSQVIRSSATSSEYTTSSGIKVLNADLWSYDTVPSSPFPTSTSTSIRGILKLFVSDSDLEKMVGGDVFYITRVNKNFILSSLSKDLEVRLPIETRWILDTYFDSSVSSDRITVSLKSRQSNNNKVVVTKSFGGDSENSVVSTPFPFSSIDIDCGEFGFYYDGSVSEYVSGFDLSKIRYVPAYSLSPIRVENVNNVFLNTLLDNGDFRKGTFESSKWVSGGNVNYLSNKIKKSLDSLNFDTGYISLVPGVTNSVMVYTDYSPMNLSYAIDDFDVTVGDYVWLDSIRYATSSSVVDMSGRYEVQAVTYSVPLSRTGVQLRKADGTIDTSLLIGGTFSVLGAETNLYSSINTFRISDSTVSRGMFIRTGFVGSTFLSSEFDNRDKNLIWTNTNKLRIENSVFSGTRNDVRSGLVYKSHFVSDGFSNGLVYNSIWNGGVFGNGVANSVTWTSGTFSDGYFINSSNLNPTSVDYDSELRIKAWMDGTFNLGYFDGSVWLKGTFNNGRLYNSTWYGGIWNNGILGTNNIPTESTNMGYLSPVPLSATQTSWYGGVVENAIVGGSGSVLWYGGKFNAGEFISFGTSSTNQSIWYNGEFNGGKFRLLSRWKNGTFAGGKFTSHYGMDMVSPTASSSVQSDYAWEYGKFTGGEFGNASTGTNSVWYDGEFNGGIFQGKFWRYGLFRNGTFNGSGPTPSVSESYDFSYANSFTSSYYGMWKDGWVAERIFVPSSYDAVAEERYTPNQKKTVKKNEVKMNNILWLSGTFSHDQGYFNNSFWLGGNFNRGYFDGGYFNPFVDRSFSGIESNSSFNTQSCVWNDGTFVTGSFFMSEWKKGLWKNGYMSGGIWRSGTWNYGTAENVYWETGVWRNGNWDGSPFGVTSLTASNQAVRKASLIISNVAQAASSSSIHIINAFTGSVVSIVSSNPSRVSHFTQTGSSLPTWVDAGGYPSSTGAFSISGDNIAVTSTGGDSKILSTASVFTLPNTKYTTRIKIYYHGSSATSFPSSFVLRVTSAGNTQTQIVSLYSTFGGVVNPVELNFTYTTPSVITDNTLQIQTNCGSPYFAYIFYVKVDSEDVNYWPIYNNLLYSGVSASVGSTASLPSSLTILEATSDYPVNNAYQRVGVKFGNGIFKAGIWENGVWNNGWRDDQTLTRFIVNTSANYIAIDKRTHRMFLTIVDSDLSGLSQFRVGNWVSVGNLVGIDIDERRVLLWNKFRIIVVGGDYIIVEYTNNFPLKRIEVDSSDHVVYVSKNLWMTGVFLNGYFTGVWNNGWLKGYPYITKMDKTYWVDGKFDGGHFISGVGSYTYSGVSYSYHTGLVQNMEFRDNNVSNPYQFSYQSWMDLIFDENSQSNFYRDQFVYEASQGLNRELPRPNLNGPITSDVMSGVSYFRNGFNNSVKEYSVGTKYNILQDYLQDIGSFDSPVFSNQIPSLGLSPFYDRDWSILSTNGQYSTPSVSGIYTLYPDRYKLYNTSDTTTDNSLTIVSSNYAEITSSGSPTGWPGGSVNVLYLDNNNSDIQAIPKGRYSMIEFDLATWSGQPGATPGSPRSFITSTNSGGDSNYYQPGINYTIYPATWSVNKILSNPLLSSTGVRTDYTKKEYFYNRKNLLLQIYAGNVTSVPDLPSGTYPFTASFDRISFYEVDRIPFFQYTTESNVDKSIQAPWKATAPFVDFTQDMVYNNYLSAVSFRLDSTSLGSISAFPTGIAASAIYAEMATSTIYTGVGSGASSGL